MFIFTVDDKHYDVIKIFPAPRHKKYRHTKTKRCGWQSLNYRFTRQRHIHLNKILDSYFQMKHFFFGAAAQCGLLRPNS
jgi:hypothetical protein